MTREEKERQLNALAFELMDENRRFTPMYPWVFVRVLNREWKTPGGIVLPGPTQNKLVAEGIVLATYVPGERWIGRRSPRKVQVECPVKVGDHIGFNHFAGVPIEGYDRERYRVVMANDFDPVNQGGVLFTIDYDDQDTSPQQKLRTTLFDMGVPIVTIDAVLQKYILVDKDACSITLSGL